MKFKDYYETLGVKRDATQDEIKKAYRKLARKYHPDVSKEKDAEARFKEMGEAYEVLKDPEKRTAFDQMGSNYRNGQEFRPPPNWDAGFEFRGADFGQDFASDAGSPFGGDHSDFFETLFGRHSRRGQGTRRSMHAQGQDHHAKVLIDLADAYRGAERAVTLKMPSVDAEGHVSAEERTLNVSIPKGVRPGQHLRLSGQGGAGIGEGKTGDLYLEIDFRPDPIFRVDGRDVYFDLPLTPWEAALGATVAVPVPDGSSLELSIPPNTQPGRKLRLKGKGIPSSPAGDLYAVMAVVQPPADGERAQEAYRALAKAFDDFDPRAHWAQRR